MRHGTEFAYRRHLADGEPFPEDTGGISCGCRTAHRLINTARRVPRITCTICERRCHRRPDGLCSRCRKAAEQLPHGHESIEIELGPGEWVQDGLILRWVPAGLTLQEAR